VDGVWIDKAYLVQKAAEQTGHALLWHKLVCRVPPGVATFGKPSYHHMLCFSKVCCLLLVVTIDDLSCRCALHPPRCLHAAATRPSSSECTRKPWTQGNLIWWADYNNGSLIIVMIIIIIMMIITIITPIPW
jgi:hypothetical protein